MACTPELETAVSPPSLPTTITLPSATAVSPPPFQIVEPPTVMPMPTETAIDTATTAVLSTAIITPTPSPTPLSLGRGRIMDADFTADGHIMAIAWASGLSLVDTMDAREIWWQPLPVPPLAIDIQAEGTAVALAMATGLWRRV